MLIAVQQNRSGLVHRLVHTICQTFLTYEASKNIPLNTVSRQLNAHAFILVFERAVKHHLRLHIQIKFLPSHQMPLSLSPWFNLEAQRSLVGMGNCYMYCAAPLWSVCHVYYIKSQSIQTDKWKSPLSCQDHTAWTCSLSDNCQQSVVLNLCRQD